MLSAGEADAVLAEVTRLGRDLGVEFAANDFEGRRRSRPAGVARRFSPRLRELVGYGVYRGLIGHIDKRSPVELLGGCGDVAVVRETAAACAHAKSGALTPAGRAPRPAWRPRPAARAGSPRRRALRAAARRRP